MTDREAFESWYYASKYAQVILPTDANYQACFDGWQAATELKNKEIVRLEKYAIQLHEENERWATETVDQHNHIQDLADKNDKLQAKLAMCVEVMRQVDDSSEECLDPDDFMTFEVSPDAIHSLRDALTATEQDVIKWKREVEAKAIEECAKHIHEYVVLHSGQAKDVLLGMAQQKRSEG